MTSRPAASLAALALAGCVHTPSAPPAMVAEQTAWAADLPASEAPVTRDWWTSFHDPALSRLMAETEARNLDLKLAAERVIEAHALRRAAAARLWPEGTASASQSDGRREPSSAVVGLGLAWEPDLSGRLSAARRAADAGLRASRYDAEAVRQLLLAEVAAAYVEYRLQSALADLAVRRAEAQAAIQDITQARFEVGAGSALDVERGATVLSQTRSEVAVARQAAEAARFRLGYLLAATPQELALWLGKTGRVPSAEPLQALMTPVQVLAGRPDVRAAADRYAEAAGSRDAVAALRFPTLTLSGLLGLEGAGLSRALDGGTGISTGLGSLVAPVVDFGARRAEILAANSRLRQAGLAYQQAALLAMQEVQTGAAVYVQAQARTRELDRAVAGARRAADLARLQYQEGALSQLDVLDAERTVFSAEQALARSGAEVSVRLIELYRAMGVAPTAPRLERELAALPPVTERP
ncbi:TolC family protein [Phenylobacterium sp. LjRoot225]|uniref:TolC family protein n=1 Tax=Phenylobacterium sp. LjRoot225 TaxID=3342285 RepID=UPI003ECE9D88